MDIYRQLARPLLFRLPPEGAQHLVEGLLQRSWLWRESSFQLDSPRLITSLAGILLSSPIGLAAGFDKECRALSGLARLGFGYLVGGTVFPVPRPGNARPRMVRLPKREALINALGFPSSGAEAAVKALESRDTGETPVLASVAALEAEDFARIHRRLEPLVQGVELNVSSPNTAGLAAFQEPETLRDVLRGIVPEKRKPLFVKLPAGFDQESRKRVLALVEVCLAEGVEGVTAGNTWPVPDERLKVGKGGLSGRPLLEEALKTVSAVRAMAGQGLAINACGGIFTGEDVFRALKAGADSVQLLTGLVYRGPWAVRDMKGELLACLVREGVGSVEEIAGGRG